MAESVTREMLMQRTIDANERKISPLEDKIAELEEALELKKDELAKLTKEFADFR
jgi:predicted  nucleic acid-binding Zn-ribbon protein